MNIYEIATNAGVLFDTKNSAGYAMPFVLIGAPGCAKSSMIEGPFARALEKHTGKKVIVITEIPATREPPDFRGLGIPVRPQDGSPSFIHYPQPDILKRVLDAVALHGGPDKVIIILFLDEVFQADTSTQKVLADLSLNYRLGEYSLPKNVWIVMASNRQADGAGVNRALTILTNRMCRFEVELPVKNWTRWARAKGLHPMGIAFVEQFPKHFVGETPPRDGAFCTYRSFTAAIETIAAYNRAHGLDPMAVPKGNAFLTNVFNGHIGEGATQEFMAYAQVADQLPSRKDIINNPDTAKVPGTYEIGAQYAAGNLATSIAMNDILDAVPAITYLMRLPTLDLVVRYLWELDKSSKGGITMNNRKAAEFLAVHKALITDAVQA